MSNAHMKSVTSKFKSLLFLNNEIYTRIQESKRTDFTNKRRLVNSTTYNVLE